MFRLLHTHTYTKTYTYTQRAWQAKVTKAPDINRMCMHLVAELVPTQPSFPLILSRIWADCGCRRVRILTNLTSSLCLRAHNTPNQPHTHTLTRVPTLESVARTSDLAYQDHCVVCSSMRILHLVHMQHITYKTSGYMSIYIFDRELGTKILLNTGREEQRSSDLGNTLTRGTNKFE